MSRRNLEDENEPETVNLLLSALSNEYNRGVVDYFRESTDPIATLDELAEYVADHQTTGATHPEQIAIRLHHTDLPKLAATGVMEYDPRSKTVRHWSHPIFEVDGVLEMAEG